MKQLAVILVSFLILVRVYADIAPNPIIIKGIFTPDSCSIRMTREYVSADLYNDSARVECIFELLNTGDSITIQTGFPVMNFQYWSTGEYSEDDKAHFRIFVDGRMLTENEIGVPAEMDSIYRAYMDIYHYEREYRRKTDSIYSANMVTVKRNGNLNYPSDRSYQMTSSAMRMLYEWRETKPFFSSDLWKQFDRQMSKGNFPWYVWNIHFGKNEKKQVKVVYSLPSGQGYGANYRYFKYILETGSGWYGTIGEAKIELKFHDIEFETLEEILPSGYLADRESKTIEWAFCNFEPAKDDDIYVRYYNIKERKIWKRYQRKRKRAIIFRQLNPVNWFG